MLLDAAAPDANIVCKRRFSACKLTTTFSISSSLSSTSTLSASAFVIWPSPLLMQGNLLKGYCQLFRFGLSCGLGQLDGPRQQFQ